MKRVIGLLLLCLLLAACGGRDSSGPQVRVSGQWDVGVSRTGSR